ncbi:hypothetical protein NIES2109_05450 [Nostoc sp. HK-01]|nr:hypothetical protein NIES2109_05450 [Nostoc sp. HK-01]
MVQVKQTKKVDKWQIDNLTRYFYVYISTRIFILLTDE